MGKASAVSVLSVGQTGQVTIPAAFRKQHALTGGAKLLAVRMGDTLVMAPHDAMLESICLRLEEAMRGAGLSPRELEVAALEERAAIVATRYGGARGRRSRPPR
jgi:bifunctional DNA-binding transcriptional regulator/antitoxin component of YhaV-PrlF toxin-antitoxin module